MVEHHVSGPARVCASCGNENPAEARFCFSCGAALEAATPTAESRKTVTVLFCDLVGSTALGEQIDPETLRALLGRSFERVSAVVERHGGVVEKFIGDAAMAVFGIPRLHEDDALRAVRAAAEIRTALETAAGAASGATIAWRTGIATGEVVAGDAASGQRLVTGDAVNVAARLQQTAQPGEILITAETHQLVRDAVEVEPLGELSVKGRQAPIEAFRLLVVDRSAAGHERRLDSPMIGRARPQRLLDEAFAEVRDQRVCHLFTILGAAGVGKSRLVNEFIRSLGDQVTVLRGRCLSYGEGITYWPIGDIVRGATAIDSASPDPDADLAKIRARIGEAPDADRIALRVAQAIGLVGGDQAPDEVPWAIRSFLEALAADQPLVVVLDDLQWAEPALLDLIENIADWSRDAPILLIVLARQELLDTRPAWGGGKRSATIISLEPLDAAETAQLIDNLLGQAELPPTVFDRIRTAAEGNPLFVEELLEMLIDEGALTRTDGGWTAGQDLASLAVPPTIQALLAARLDGLAGAERAVLERGAVEGTVFHRDAVAALAPETMRDNVGSSLMTLTRREFVAPDRAELAGREAFRFRHQLIRDAAYQAIAKQSRADLHERFADWLEAALGDRVDEYRPILAYHLEQAARYRRDLDPADPALPELELRAIDLLGRAGADAMNRSDMDAAASTFRRALAIVEGDEAAALPWRLQLGEALVRAAPVSESNAFLLDVRARAEALGDERSATLAEAHRLHLRASMAEPLEEVVPEAEAIYKRLLELGGDPAPAARAGLELAKYHFWVGQAQAGIDLARNVLATPGLPRRLLEEIASWISAFAYWGPTPTSTVLAMADDELARGPTSLFLVLRLTRHRAATLAQRELFVESEAAFEKARQISEDLGDPLLLASVTGHFHGPSRLLAGDAEGAVQLGHSSFDGLMALGHAGFANTTAAYMAQAYLELGRDEEAERWARVAIESGDARDPAAAGPAFGTWARVLARRGQFDEAEAKAHQSLEIWGDSDNLDQVADAHFDLAEVLRLAGRPEEAAQELRVALDLYERKEHLVGARQAREALARLGVEGQPPNSGS
ncbi:MAG TPA: adenylate/guanylate cyclase domain-containing protein [Candidatus Limnocylindria bacterium]|nr:adenylate/guanylate cyclase domain-containing protein [Candidatus Limnocylindria bacterium]